MSVATKKILIRLNSAWNTWYDSRDNGIHFSSDMPSCICHMERNICDNFTLRFRDEESDGAYFDLDLKTNGSDPDYKPLPSEEMDSFGLDIDISDIVWLSSPELHVPFYRRRIVVRVTFLRVQVCHCHICSMPLWCLSGPVLDQDTRSEVDL